MSSNVGFTLSLSDSTGAGGGSAMKEQEFGGREVGRGWIRTETCGKGSRAAGLTETQVDGFDQGNGNSLSCEVHHDRMRALHGIRLEFSKALEHGCEHACPACRQQRQQRGERSHAGTDKWAHILSAWLAQCWLKQSQDHEPNKWGCPG